MVEVDFKLAVADARFIWMLCPGHVSVGGLENLARAVLVAGVPGRSFVIAQTILNGFPHVTLSQMQIIAHEFLETAVAEGSTK